MPKLQRVKAESLRSQVYVQLRNKLTDGTWKVAEKLPSENKLCASFGVSRVTVRAAIQQLEILGLVETKQGGGTYVRDFSSANALDALHPMMRVRKNQDIINVLEYRMIIEKGTVGLAMPKVSEEDIEFLESTYAAMESCTDDPKAHAASDHRFHYRIAQVAGNPMLLKVYALIDELLSAAMVDVVAMLGCEIGLRYHRRIIDALKARDQAACESLMEAHIEETIQSVLASDVGRE